MNDKPGWKRALNQIHQGLAGLIGRRAVGRDTSLPNTGTGFQKLPPEIMEKVVKDLAIADPDPRATARNLNNLRQASRGMRDFVDNTPSVGTFSATLNEAGRLARDIHERVYPKKKLPNVHSPVIPHINDMHEGLRQPVPAGSLLAAVGPVQKFQSAQVNAKIARDVRAIFNRDARAEGIAATAQNIGSLDPKDQSSLIRNAIKNLGAKGPLNTFRRHMAAEAIVGARNRLQPEHQSDLAKILNRRPELNELIVSRIDRLELLRLGRSRVNMPEVSRDLSKEIIGWARDDFHETSTSKRLTEHQRVDRFGRIAMVTSNVVDEARAQLMKSERSRDSRGL